MPWCNNCKDEYVQGIKSCPECGEQLVDKEEIPTDINYDDTKLKQLFIIENDIEFSLITDALRQDDVLFSLSTEPLWDHMQILYNPTLIGQKVFVLDSDYEKAKTIYDYFKELKEVWSEENEE